MYYTNSYNNDPERFQNSPDLFIPSDMQRKHTTRKTATVNKYTMKMMRGRRILEGCIFFFMFLTFALLLCALFGGHWWLHIGTNRDDHIGLFRSCTTYFFKDERELLCYFRKEVLQFSDTIVAGKDFDIMIVLWMIALISCIFEILFMLGVTCDRCKVIEFFPCTVILFTLITFIITLAAVLFVDYSIQPDIKKHFGPAYDEKGWSYDTAYAALAMSIIAFILAIVMFVFEMKRHKETKFKTFQQEVNRTFENMDDYSYTEEKRVARPVAVASAEPRRREYIVEDNYARHDVQRVKKELAYDPELDQMDGFNYHAEIERHADQRQDQGLVRATQARNTRHEYHQQSSTYEYGSRITDQAEQHRQMRAQYAPGASRMNVPPHGNRRILELSVDLEGNVLNKKY